MSSANIGRIAAGAKEALFPLADRPAFLKTIQTQVFALSWRSAYF